MMYLLFSLLLLFSGCQNSRNTLQMDDQVTEQLENEQGVFEFSYDSGSYQFTDTLNVRLSAEPSSGFILPESLPEPGDKWGDFTVMKRFQDAGESVCWFLTPDKSGIAVLSGLELLISSREGESLLRFSDSEIEIVSSLMNDSGAPADLIPPEENRDFPVLPILIIAVVLMTGGLVLFFFLRKMKQRRERALEKNSRYYLQKMQALEQDPHFQDSSRKEQYRRLYSLLTLFLNGLSVSLRTGLEPAQLMKELEKPSGLNQWALRSLYPILQETEDIFYNPAHAAADEETLSGQLRTVVQCCEFLQKEEEAAHV